MPKKHSKNTVQEMQQSNRPPEGSRKEPLRYGAAYEPEKIQRLIQSSPDTLLNAAETKVGSFKKVIPIILPDKGMQLGLSVMAARQGQQGKEQLKQEFENLKLLRANGFPALKTYGNIFKNNQGEDAMIIDWIDNATMIEAKSSENLKYVLSSFLIGLPAESGKESQVASIRSNLNSLLNRFERTNLDFDAIKKRATKLQYQVDALIRQIESKKMVIADLQLLIAPTGELTIIDPLDVLLLRPKQHASLQSPLLRDRYDFHESGPEGKLITGNTVKEIDTSLLALHKISRICKSLAEVEEKRDLKQALYNVIESSDDLDNEYDTSSSPSSPSDSSNSRNSPLR
jgi:hypothetical protein